MRPAPHRQGYGRGHGQTPRDPRPSAFSAVRRPASMWPRPLRQTAGTPRARPARLLPRLLSPAAGSILLAAPPAPRRPPSTPLSPRPRRGLRVPLHPHPAAVSPPRPLRQAAGTHLGVPGRADSRRPTPARPSQSSPASAPARPHGLRASPSRLFGLPARGQCGAATAAAKHGAGASAPAGEAGGEQRPSDTHLRGAAAAGARRAGRRGGRRGRGGANGAAAPPPTAAQPSPAGLRGALDRRLRARRAPRLGRGRRRRHGRLRPARGPAGRRTRTRSFSDACRGAARSPAKQTMRRALRPARCVRDAPRPPPP